MGADHMNASFGEQSYAIVDAISAKYNGIFAHEMGHIFGASHDVDHGGPGLFSYSSAYKFPYQGQSYRTVMAYGEEILVSTFSNPARLHPVLKVPVGAADHNNGDTIRQTARIVQAFRPSKIRPGQP